MVHVGRTHHEALPGMALPATWDVACVASRQGLPSSFAPSRWPLIAELGSAAVKVLSQLASGKADVNATTDHWEDQFAQKGSELESTLTLCGLHSTR
jgi:hypothetical protein